MNLSSAFVERAFGSVASTMDLAKDYIAAPDCDRGKIGVIWAQSQGSGRGRLGRSWVSEPGNLYVSFVLFPRVPLSSASQLSFACALAVGKTLGACGIDSYAYKWPNDVFVNRAKISGVLLELETLADGAYAVIVGIGLNIAHSPDQAMYPTTHMNREGQGPFSVESVLPLLCDKIKETYDQWQADGFEPLRQAWLEKALVRPGDPLRVTGGHGPLEGHMLDVGGDGTLWIESPAGERLAVKAGDVWFR